MRHYHEEAKEILKAAGCYTLQDVLDRIAEGSMQSFVKNNSWVVTQINAFPRKKVVEVFMVVGDMDDVKSMEPEVEAFALAEGAVSLTTYASREGWNKAHSEGWSRIGFLLERKLQ